MYRTAFLFAAFAALLGAGRPAVAQEFLFSGDVPFQIGATFYRPNQIVRRASSGSFGLFFDGPAQGLGPDVHITALAALPQGAFLFAADAPFTAGGSTYLPFDVVRFTGTGYSLYQSGAAVAIPPGTLIDALALDASGVLYYSFDVPATIAGRTYLPDDVARLVAGNLSPFLSGAGDLGLPQGSDIVGFGAPPGGDYLFTFRTPTTLAGTTYLPTQIVRLRGGSWGLYWSGGQPASGVVATFSLPASPGAVPGGGPPGTVLTLEKKGGDVALAWGASCTTDADDYAVYRGSLGIWYSHGSILCTTGGATTATVTPGGDEYYLVVPLNGTFEGSYGAGSTGSEIPQGTGACREYWDVSPCP
jgi:hypothetical protein